MCSAQVLCIASVPGASPSDYIDTPIEIPAEVQEAKVETATEVPKLDTAEIVTSPAKASESTESNTNTKQSTRSQEDSDEAAIVSILLNRVNTLI